MKVAGVLVVLLAIAGALWWYAGEPDSYVYRKAPAAVGAPPQAGEPGTGPVAPK